MLSFRALGNLLLFTLMPRGCAACDARLDMRAATSTFCSACALSVVRKWAAPRSHLPFAVCSPFAYGGALQTALTHLKFEGRSDLAAPLGALLAAELNPEGFRGIGALIPVPSDPARLALRGYNPAGLLAQALGSLVEVPIRHALARHPSPIAQVGLSRAVRQTNVREAFFVSSSETLRISQEGKPVVLVDDVVTTGATLAACAKALRLAGVSVRMAITLASADL